jgi:thiamine transport system permease protein
MVTLEVEIYIQAMHRLNLPLAGFLSLLQLGFTAVVGALHQKLVKLNTSNRLTVIEQPHRKMVGLRQKFVCFAIILIIGTIAILPVAALLTRSFTRLAADRGQRGDVQTGITFDFYKQLFINSEQSVFYVQPFVAVKNSIAIAAATTLLSISLGLITAYSLQKKNSISRLLDILIILPLGTSAITLGYGFILIFHSGGSILAGSPALLPVVHSLIALPFVTRTLKPAVSEIPEGLRQTARTLGASGKQVFFRVDLPLLARTLITCAILSFTISLGEFGAASMLVRPDMPTIPVAIYRFLAQPGGLNYGQAMAMSSLLLLVCAVAITLLEKVELSSRRIIGI